MSAADPFRSTVRWLAVNTRFPSSRLEPKSEVLVCIAALAAAAADEERQRHLPQRRNPAETSAQRTHALRRSQVHFKCDNSAKV